MSRRRRRRRFRRRAPAEDAGDVAVLEGEHRGVPAHREEDCSRLDQEHPRALGVALDGEQDPAELVVVEAEHGGSEPEVRARRGRGSRGRIVLGRIEHPAAADAILLLQDEGRAPGGGEDLARGEAGGARAHHRDVHGEALGGAGGGRRRVRKQAEAGQVTGDGGHDLLRHRHPGEHRVVVHPLREEPVDAGEDVDLHARVGVLPLDSHPGPHGRLARETVGHTVDAHQAVRAGPGHAVGAAGPVVLDAPGEHGLPGGEERARRRLALAGGERLALVLDGQLRAGLRRQAAHAALLSEAARRCLSETTGKSPPRPGSQPRSRVRRGVASTAM